ncbi:hypothetical protein BHE74_00004735 [Ensete ventricosum]|nr:hypothetical protein BHE74_00004735 [Ensete ventricosum]RZS08146.1 hypothetical protein BHM03_00039115 [Ensete ventricosum]
MGGKEKEEKKRGVVAVNPKPRKGLVSATVDLIERVIVYLMHDAKTPLHYLAGNFAPVRDETPPFSDLPVRGTLPVNVVRVLEDGDLQTLGMLDYDKRLAHSFTAHPKVDPVTDEMFTFGYSHVPPYVTYRVITKDGVMLDPVPITIPDPVMMHDFAITENYAIFMDLPLYFRPKNPDLDQVNGAVKDHLENFTNELKSEVNVIDAKTMSADPVAVVELPARVPHGFHAFFVTEVSNVLNS